MDMTILLIKALFIFIINNILGYVNQTNIGRLIIYLALIIIVVIGLIYKAAKDVVEEIRNEKYEVCVEKWLENVKDNADNKLMNFGYWKNNPKTLKDANEELCNLVFTLAQINKGDKILDVGCGNGVQDILLKEKTENCIIEAIDIDEKAIMHATKKSNELKIKNLKYKVGDAINLDYNDGIFDKVICIESAFHYNTRYKFLKEAYRVLKPGGRLIIADIIGGTPKDIYAKYYRDIFSYTFNIPDKNIITRNKLINQMKKIGFKTKCYDITDYTFEQYYKYFFSNVILSNMALEILRNVMLNYMNKSMGRESGLNYVICVCEKE